MGIRRHMQGKIVGEGRRKGKNKTNNDRRGLKDSSGFIILPLHFPSERISIFKL